MTNLLPIILLLTNPVPVETIYGQTRLDRIEKLSLIKREIVTYTNAAGFLCTTNDFLIGHILKRSTGTVVWTEAPIPFTDSKTNSPLPFSPGSVRQQP